MGRALKKSSIECFRPRVDTLGNSYFEISFSARADVRKDKNNIPLRASRDLYRGKNFQAK